MGRNTTIKLLVVESYNNNKKKWWCITIILLLFFLSGAVYCVYAPSFFFLSFFLWHISVGRWLDNNWIPFFEWALYSLYDSFGDDVDQIDDGREERSSFPQQQQQQQWCIELMCCPFYSGGTVHIVKPQTTIFFFLFSWLYSLHHKYNQLVRINLSILH